MTSYINAPFSMAYLFVSSKQLLIEIITDNRAAFFYFLYFLIILEHHQSNISCWSLIIFLKPDSNKTVFT